MEEYKKKSDQKSSVGVTFVKFHIYVFRDAKLQT